VIYLRETVKKKRQEKKYIRIMQNYINGIKLDRFLNSPMDQFEIKPFLGEFLGLNYTPVGLITNILIYIGLTVAFI
jgi:hypothetical protein